MFRGGGAAVLLLVVCGCARLPSPLPAAVPNSLPAAWLDPLREEPVPGALRADARIDVASPRRTPVVLDGRFEWDGPGRVRLFGAYGRFRPVFSLAADGDSAVLLLQQDRMIWGSALSQVDWVNGNPSAWVQGLAWAIGGPGFLSRFEPEGPGTLDGSVWVVRGRVPDLPYLATLRIDPRRRALRVIELETSDGKVATLEMSEHGWYDSAWIPRRVRLDLHVEGLRVEITLTGLRHPPDSAAPISLPRPEGWRRVRPGEVLRLDEGMALPRTH